MLRDSRTATARQKVRLDLRVKGLDIQGKPFQEETQSYDVSEEGISFCLRTPIWISSHVTIEKLLPGQSPEILSAMVIRIKTEAIDSQSVAARFD
jgi:hypothetical protein